MVKKAFDIIPLDEYKLGVYNSEVWINGKQKGFLYYDDVHLRSRGYKLYGWLEDNDRQAANKTIGVPFDMIIGGMNSLLTEGFYLHIVIIRVDFESADKYLMVVHELPLTEISDSTLSSEIITRDDLDKYALLFTREPCKKGELNNE